MTINSESDGHGDYSEADLDLSRPEVLPPALVARRRRLRLVVGCFVLALATFALVALRAERARRELGAVRGLSDASNERPIARLSLLEPAAADARTQR